MSERFDTRVPPNNIDAEKSVLGCCMSDYEILNQITALLRTEAFYQPTHRTIYDAILNLSMSGKAVDTLTVSAELEKCLVNWMPVAAVHILCHCRTLLL